MLKPNVRCKWFIMDVKFIWDIDQYPDTNELCSRMRENILVILFCFQQCPTVASLWNLDSTIEKEKGEKNQPSSLSLEI